MDGVVTTLPPFAIDRLHLDSGDHIPISPFGMDPMAQGDGPVPEEPFRRSTETSDPMTPQKIPSTTETHVLVEIDPLRQLSRVERILTHTVLHDKWKIIDRCIRSTTIFASDT